MERELNNYVKSESINYVKSNYDKGNLEYAHLNFSVFIMQSNQRRMRMILEKMHAKMFMEHLLVKTFAMYLTEAGRMIIRLKYMTVEYLIRSKW